MMLPWLMRSLRPCRVAHAAVGEAKLRPGRLGAVACGIDVSLARVTSNTRPGEAV